jgi:flagellar basal body-associated protein FliL
MAKSAQLAAKKPPPAGAKKDTFAVFIALIAVTLLIVCLAIYFFLHSQPTYDAKQDYLALPQFTFEGDGQVVQLKMTIQVSEKDKEWADKNNFAINEIFKKVVQDNDPAIFRTKEGSEAVQKKIKNEINHQMKVDKVKAVLYSDILIQYKVE